MKFLSFVFCLAPAFLVAQEYDFSNIENSIAIHDEQQLISGTVLISKDGSTLFAESFGYADWEHQTPITDNTRFSIGSITKSLTQIIVSQLVEKGSLNLDESVNTYILNFPESEQGSSVTIAHLLNHRSGVPHRVTNAIDEAQALNAQSIVERVIARGLLFEPGSRRLYSSAGYTSLARVTELASNASYSDLLESRIFEPAEMINAINEPGPGLLPNKARAYRLGTTTSLVVKNSPYKDLRFLDGAGSVYATTTDLLNLINAITAGIFGNEIRDSILDPNAAGRSSIAGRTNGYEAWIDYYPSENISVVFLSNLQSASHWQIRDQILNVIEGREAAIVPLPPLPAEPFEDDEEILGTYGGAVITKQEGKLFRGENEFYSTANNRYYIPGSGSSMRFERNTAGESIALIHINPDESTRTIERSD